MWAWLTGLFKPEATDIRRIGADLGLIEDAVPLADAYSIRLFDDDITPIEFVIDNLQATLDLTRRHAIQLALHVHQHGTADVGRMSVDRAQVFVTAMLSMAHEHKQPFRCEVVRHESASDIV
jgi:ATP-dependent Clp protease adapter protein ClpS